MTLIIPVLVIVSLIVWSWFHGKSKKLLPPGPYPLPIIGNILQLGRNPHTSLAKLSKKYGPLMYLKLGTLDTIVVSSPDMAKQVLQKHDRLFSGRTIPHAVEVYDFSKNSMGFLPVDDKWKMLRNICKEHMFSTHQLDKSGGLRQDKLRDLHDYITECCESGRAINIGETVFTMIVSLTSATLFSYDFGAFGSDSAQKIKRLVRTMIEAIGAPNVSDFFPILKLVDPQGIKRDSVNSVGKLLEFLEDIINKRLEESKGRSSTEENDLLDVLIRLDQDSESEFRCEQIKFILLDLFAGATDTTSTMLEWVMTELLRNPDKMAKVEYELGAVIGERKHVEESDIPNLPYLQAVVKETLRYHAPAPLALPHKALADVEINGYNIPKNTQVLVNVWAINRDPSVWANPESFEPERFLESNLNFKGQHFEYIPFGSGRRMCPGMPLANRMVPLVLASMIHGFHWKLDGGMKPNEIDMTERFVVSLEKAIPLKAIPVSKILRKPSNT